MDIKEQIRSARKKANLTQRELSEKAGMAIVTIQQYESGKRQPRVSQLTKIAAALGVGIDELLGNPGRHTDQKEKPAEADIAFDDFTYAMHEEAKELTEEDKNMLLAMARMLRERQRKGPIK